jgi:hypothetical protein
LDPFEALLMERKETIQNLSEQFNYEAEKVFLFFLTFKEIHSYFTNEIGI